MASTTYTTQSAFDISAAHLLTQNRQSLRSEGDRPPSCAYRGDDRCMCAIGVLIPDDIYRPEMEGLRFSVLHYRFNTIRTLFDGVDIWVLAQLQGIHDGTNVKDWAADLLHLAERHNLDDSVITDAPAGTL